MSSGSSRSGSGSGQNRRPPWQGREQRDLEQEYTSPPAPTIFDTSVAHLMPKPDPPLPDPPVPQAPAPPRKVDKSLSFAGAAKKPKGASPVPARTTGGGPPLPRSQPSSRQGNQIGQGGLPTPASDPPQSLQDNFKHLLTTQGKVGDGKSYYERRAIVMASLTKAGVESYTLDVDFNHLLDDGRYIHLAVKCCKDKQDKDMWHGWLQPIARDFLNSEFKLEETDKLRLEFRFINEPKSVKPLRDYPTAILVKKEFTFRGKYEQRKTTHTGRQVYLAVVDYILGQHHAGKSWNGKFNLDSIYIIEYPEGFYVCRIVAGQKKSADLSENVADLQKMNRLVTPKYELDGMFPAYFDALSEDLSLLTVKKLKETGFLIYLPFHFAFMTSKACRFLLGEFYLFTLSPKLDSEISRDDYELVFYSEFGIDWRVPFKDSKDPILKGVYQHDNSGVNGQKVKGPEAARNQDKDKFGLTVKGMLDYERHVVHHAYHHLCGSGDDSELYAAWKIPQLLPRIIRRLFNGKKMKLQKE